MTKMIVSLEEAISASANPYLSEDGLLNFSKLDTLQERVAKQIKAASKPGTQTGGVAQPLKVVGTYVMKRRAKPVAFRKAAHEKGTDLKYRAGRAIKVALRKRITPESLARVAVVLQIVDDAKLNPLLKQAQSAIAQHMKRTERHVAKISTEKAKIRDAANSTFEKSGSMITAALLQGGIKEKDIVAAMGMMGRSILVRLGPDNYVSITKADKTRFSAAVRASNAA